MKHRLLCLVCAFALGVEVSAAERVALVVGCGNYRAPSAPALDTPLQDAKDLSALLSSPALGFEVIPVLDATSEDFYAGLRKFKTRAQGARIALIFFSGHGIENEGQNYLITVNATLDSQDQLETQTVNLERVMKALANTNAAVKLAILDCCRDNPFARTKSWMKTKAAMSDAVLRALGEAEIPEATLVCFATSAGRKAAAVLRDGSKNSPFTELLLEELPKPQQPLRTIFENVHDRLKRATAGRQVPTVRTDNALSELFRQTVLVAKAPHVPSPPGGFLGLRLHSPSPQAATGSGPKDHGAQVKDVDVNGPAAQAGLKRKDVIVAVDNEKITKSWELMERVNAKRPGDRVLLTFTREGIEGSATVTLADVPPVLRVLRQAAELRRERKLTEALALLTRTIDSGYNGSRLAEMYLSRATTYRELKDYRRALEESQKVIDRFPNDSDGFKARGSAYQGLGRTAEADADFKKAEELQR